MSDMPKVAIVILNYNGKHWLEKFLPSVCATQYPNFQLIIADNASTDESVTWLEKHYPQVSIICLEKNWGYAEGYNRSIAQIDTNYTYCVLLNSDIAVEPNWLEELVLCMERNPNLAACQPKVLSYHQPEFFEYAGAAGGFIDALGYPFCRGRILEYIEKDTQQYNTDLKTFWASGCALMIRRELFIEIGGFEADFFAHMEEIDLCWRLQRAGFDIGVCTKAIVYHVGGGTLPQGNPRKLYLNIRNNWAMLFRNLAFRHWFWVFPLRSLIENTAAMMALLKGKFSEFVTFYRAHLTMPFLFYRWIKQRQAIKRKIRAISPDPKDVSQRQTYSIVWQAKILRHRKFSELPKPTSPKLK
ncbi:MAG: glycosyltransferase family 2 protein [Chitinophagales bacterium]|nr:glycosyltransferase family 2 protein [Bacteroidota bacterium]